MAQKALFSKRRPATRRDLLESLENRQLMAGFSANFNFQPSYSATAPGYHADTGAAYGWQTSGQQHGWNVGNTANVKDRHSDANERYDTLAQFGGNGAATTWEVAVPNGQYDVKITAGDAIAVDSHYVINVEGTTLINETPNWSNRWAEGSGKVWVGDGKLTVTSGAGAWNNKINSIQISQTDGSTDWATGSAAKLPAAASWSGAWAISSSAVTIAWGDASNNESGFIIERGTDGWNFGEIGRTATNTTTFTDWTAKAGTKYYYRVKAFNAVGAASPSTASNTTTPGAAPVWTPPVATPAPAAPGWAYAGAAGTSLVGVGWGDVANETGYIIQRSTDGWTFGEIARATANTTWYNDTAVTGGTKYYYRIQAYNAGGSSANSTVVNATTAGAVWTPAPTATGWVGPIGADAASVSIAWGDVSHETGYIIEKSTDGWNFSEAGRVGANVTTFKASGLNAGTKYTFRVKAFNTGGTTASSPFSASTTAAWTAPTVAKPSKVGWFGGWAASNNSAALSWGDVSNETGYIVERSTDGWNFAEVGRVGANAVTYTATGLTAGQTYAFRVKAYNSGGTADASTTGWVTIPGWSNNGNANNGSNNGSNGGSSSTITNKYALSGVSANGSGTNANVYKASLDDVGVKNVRIWYSFTNWHDTTINSWYAERAASYKAAGFKVMLAVLNPNPTDYNTAKAFYTRLAANAGLRNSVDYWQIGNEPNIPEFWHGSLQQYVNTMLKPGYEALKPWGETVVGAGPSWDVNAAKQLTSYGYTNYCDYAAFHPYGDNAATVLERARGAKAAFNNKPLMVTEWNITNMTYSTSAWVSELNKAAVGLSQIADMNYYFAMVNSATGIGTAGLLNWDGSRNSPFYNAMKGWLK